MRLREFLPIGCLREVLSEMLGLGGCILMRGGELLRG